MLRRHAGLAVAVAVYVVAATLLLPAGDLLSPCAARGRVVCATLADGTPECHAEHRPVVDLLRAGDRTGDRGALPAHVQAVLRAPDGWESAVTAGTLRF